MIQDNIILAAIYGIALSILYFVVKHKYIEEMVKKQVITTAGSKEIKMILELIYVALLVLGISLSLISTVSIVYLIIALLIVTAIISYDITKSVMFYYVIILTKIITQGDFVIMARGLRGWVKRITPFFVELHGEYGEVIRIPNSLAIHEPVRLPSRALPLILTIKFNSIKETKLDELDKVVHDTVSFTKRFSVVQPKLKLRNVGNEYVEFEVIYGLNNYEASDSIIKLLASKLIPYARSKNMKVEIKRELSIIGKL